MNPVIHPYRGKRVDNGEWIEGHYCFVGYTNSQKDYIIPTYASAFYGIEVIPDTVGQYTGLTDSKGIEIFRGDRFKRGDDVGTIVFEAGSFRVLWDEPYTWGIERVLYMVYDEGEVIGNRWDNPQLIESTEPHSAAEAEGGTYE